MRLPIIQKFRRVIATALTLLPLCSFAWPFSSESNLIDLTPIPANNWFAGESGIFSLVSTNAGAIASVEWLKVENDGQLYSVRLSLANPGLAPTNRPLSIAVDAGNISSIYVLDSGGNAVPQEDAFDLVLVAQNGIKMALSSPPININGGFVREDRTDKRGNDYTTYRPSNTGWLKNVWKENFIYQGWIELPLYLDYPIHRKNVYADVILDAVLQPEISDGTANNEAMISSLKSLADGSFAAWLQYKKLPEISLSSRLIMLKIETGNMNEVTIEEVLQVSEDIATVLSDRRVLQEIAKSMKWKKRIPKNAGKNFERLADSLAVATALLNTGQRLYSSAAKVNMLHVLASSEAEDRLEALDAYRAGWSERDPVFDAAMADAKAKFQEMQDEFFVSLPNVLVEAAKDGLIVDAAKLYVAVGKLFGQKAIGKVLLPYFISWEIYKSIIHVQEDNAQYSTVSATIGTGMWMDADGLLRFRNSMADDLEQSGTVKSDKVEQNQHILRIYYYLGAYSYGRLRDLSDNVLTGLVGDVFWGQSYDEAIAAMHTNQYVNMSRTRLITGPAYLSLHADTLNLSSTDDEYGWLSRLVRGTIPTNPPPVIAADFDVVTPSSGFVPMTVQFWDSSTGASQRDWDFGDGSTNATKNPSHTFTNAGVFTVCLTVYNGTGGQGTISKTVTVRERPPTAKFVATSSTSGTVPLTVAFQDQSQGAISQWSWSFGDGSSSTNRNPSHTFTNAGSYSVRLRVTGPGGNGILVKTNLVTVAGPVGTLQILCNLTNGSFQAIGPTWFVGSGSSTLFSNVPPGNYTVSFGSLYGYSTPASVEVVVSAGSQTSATGSYASGADLSLRNLSFNAASTYKAGDALVVSGSLLNLGGTPVGGGQPFQLEFRLSPVAVLTNDIVLGRRGVSAVLAGGGVSVWTNTLAIPDTAAPGSYYLVAIADPDNNFAETDESNNQAWSAGATLVVARPPIVLTGPRLLPGGLLELTLKGMPAGAYLIEKSEDLKTWTVLTSCVCSNGFAIVPLGSMDLSRKQQFFRAVELNRPIIPQLMDEARPATSTFQFRLLGEPAKQFEIQASTNLVQWSVVTTITTTNPLVPLTLPTDSSAGRHFFRARQLP